MKIFLGADHRGFNLKNHVYEYLKKQKYEVVDVGNQHEDGDDDFPRFAQAAATKVLSEEESKNPKAILICGGGQGMCMAANRFKGIRACLVWDEYEAKMSRFDNDSNILCLPARVLEDNEKEWKNIIDTWLKTDFSGAPRFRRRNAQIDEV